MCLAPCGIGVGVGVRVQGSREARRPCPQTWRVGCVRALHTYALLPLSAEVMSLEFSPRGYLRSRNPHCRLRAPTLCEGCCLFQTTSWAFLPINPPVGPTASGMISPPCLGAAPPFGSSIPTCFSCARAMGSRAVREYLWVRCINNSTKSVYAGDPPQ